MAFLEKFIHRLALEFALALDLCVAVGNINEKFKFKYQTQIQTMEEAIIVPQTLSENPYLCSHINFLYGSSDF